MRSEYQQHPDSMVRRKLLELNNAICSWERSTGRTSLLVLREQGGFVFRSASGKLFSVDNDDISDEGMVAVEAPDTMSIVAVAIDPKKGGKK